MLFGKDKRDDRREKEDERKKNIKKEKNRERREKKRAKEEKNRGNKRVGGRSMLLRYNCHTTIIFFHSGNCV